MSHKVIRVGSRRSDLALYQTNRIIHKLKVRHPEYHFEIVEFVTKGDQVLDKGFKDIGGKGLFIKELQDAMLSEKIDFAVHSFKDMPTELTGGTKIAAIDERDTPFDALVMPLGQTHADLKADAIIGTSSIRREAQLLDLMPACTINMLRGNVPTRVSRLDEGKYDAIVLAGAGLKRLNLQDRITHLFTIDDMVPAVAQGAIVIETPISTKYKAMLNGIQHTETFLATSAERAFLSELDGNCSEPIGAYGIIKDECITLHGLYGDSETKKTVRGVIHGNVLDRYDLAKTLAEDLRRKLEAYAK